MFSQSSPYKNLAPSQMNQPHFIQPGNVIIRRSPGGPRINLPLADSGPKFLNGLPMNAQFLPEELYNSQVIQPAAYSRKGSPNRFEGVSLIEQSALTGNYFSNERSYEMVKTEPREGVSGVSKTNNLVRASVGLGFVNKYKHDVGKEKQRLDKLLESYEERKKVMNSDAKNQSLISNGSHRHSRNSSKESINILQASSFLELERFEGLFFELVGEVVQVKDEVHFNNTCQDFENLIQILKQFDGNYKKTREIIVKSEAKQKILTEENERLQKSLREKIEEISSLKRRLLERGEKGATQTGRNNDGREAMEEGVSASSKILERNKEIEIWKEKYFEVEAELLKSKSFIRTFENKVKRAINSDKKDFEISSSAGKSKESTNFSKDDQMSEEKKKYSDTESYIDTLISEKLELKNLLLEKLKEIDHLRARTENPIAESLRKKENQENSSSNIKLNALRLELDRVSSNLVARDRELKNKAELCETYEREIKSLNLSYSQLESKINILVEDNEKLAQAAQESMEVQKAVREKDREIERFAERVKELETRLSSIMAHSEERSLMNMSMEEGLRKTQKPSETKRSKNDGLGATDRSMDYAQVLESYKNAIRGLVEEKDYLQKQVEELRKEVLQQTCKIEELLNDNEKLTEAYQNKMRELEAASQRYEQDYIPRSEHLSLLASQSELIKKSRLEAGDSQKNQIESQKKDLEALKRRLEEAEKLLRQEREKNQFLEKRAEDSRLESDELKQLNALWEDKIAQLMSENERITKILEEKSEQFERASSEKARLLEEAEAELRAKFEEWEEAKSSLKAEIASYQNIMDTDKQEKANLVDKYKKRSKERKILAQEFQVSIETMKKEYMSLQSNILQYETTVQEAEKRHELEKENLLSENRQLSEHQKELLKQLNEISGQFNEYKGVQDQIREHLQNTHQIEKKALENELLAAKERLSIAEKRFAKEKLELEEQRRKNEELAKKLRAQKEAKEEADFAKDEALQNLRAELDAHKKIFLDQQRDVLRIDSLKQQYESQIRQLKDIIGNNKEELEKLYSLIDTRKEEFEKLDMKSQNFERELRASETKCAHLLREIETLSVSYNEIVRESESLRESLREVAEDRERMLAQFERDSVEVREKLKALMSWQLRQEENQKERS